MSIRLAICLLLTTLLCFLPGCNIFEGMSDPGASDDPAVLLEDADLALQEKDPASAIEYLRKARPLAPKGSRLETQVSLKLAGALLAQRGITSTDLLAMARSFDPGAASVNASAASKTSTPVCSFEDAKSTTPFDPADLSSYPKLEASKDALAEAQALVDEVLAGTDADVDEFACTTETIEAGIARLRTLGLSDYDIADALLSDAVAHATLAYLEISSAGGDQATFYHVKGSDGSKYIGYCFPDATTCAIAVEHVTHHVAGINCARLLLRARAELLSSPTATEVADLADEAYETLLEGLATATCTGSAG